MSHFVRFTNQSFLFARATDNIGKSPIFGDRSADRGTGARWVWPICNTLKSNRGSQALCHAAVSLDLQTEVAFSKMRSARAMMGITGCFTEILVSGFFRDAV